MDKQGKLLLILGASIAAYLFYNRQQVSDTAQNALAASEATMVGWKNVDDGPKWVPYLNMAETQFNIPTDLLARIAYQESHFRPDIISGSKVSSVGALGLMQMMPQYFKSVNVPRPYTDQDTLNQINEAAGQLSSLYNSTGSWQLAVAAYNAGLGNVRKYGGIPPFPETQTYVADITADVPAIANA